MSADAGFAPITARCRNARAASATTPVPLILLGTGQVGRALLARLAELDPDGRFRLHVVANSRAWTLGKNGLDRRFIMRTCAVADADRHSAEPLLSRGWCGLDPDFDPVNVLEEADRGGHAIIVDATASDEVADRHAGWLARGHHIVTANKLGLGTTLRRWRAIQEARRATGSGYGDSATVGAGLPLLSSLRALVAGGDRILGIEGVLSGSLAWLFERYDGSQPFSRCVREAVAAGYTEPDPRSDLSGEDVRRKLLILVRSAGQLLDNNQVRVESLLPPTLIAASSDQVDAALILLDMPMQHRLRRAECGNAVLRCIARFDGDSASVAVQALTGDHPLASGRGTDNRVLIRSDRYHRQPLLIQGPGAGADLTAAALFDDLRRIADGIGR